MVPPTFSDRLTSKEVREGDQVHFTIRVAGNPPPEVTWYREGSQIVSSPDFEIQQVGNSKYGGYPSPFKINFLTSNLFTI